VVFDVWLNVPAQIMNTIMIMPILVLTATFGPIATLNDVANPCVLMYGMWYSSMIAIEAPSEWWIVWL
jgi:hypothetical protein